jgi:hypothetical protein
MKVMNTEDVQEGNKLIAEFMGYKRNDGYSGDFARLKHWNIEPFGWHDDEQLKYHSSWDWLMPVVKKCCICNNKRGMTIFNQNDFYIGDIDAVWQSAVHFIKRYNQQSK